MSLARNTASACCAGALSVVLACQDSSRERDARDVERDARRDACVALTLPPACEPPLDVGTAEEVVRLIGALAESVEGPLSHAHGEALRPTRDLRFTAPVELEVAPFVQRERCPAATEEEDREAPVFPCTETWRFSSEKTTEWRNLVDPPLPSLPFPPGVACKSSDCSELTVAPGTVVRFQRGVELHGFTATYLHTVRVARPCTEPCGADELRCTTATTCIAESAFCLLCQGGSNAECACHTVCDATPEETDCSYARSDDLRMRGTCRAGACSPGQAPR
ncbi:MAG: hypothetical protein KF850_01235 [Labilithrix sp.]|nr:hypothetical protein [Labilithrix sp.]